MSSLEVARLLSSLWASNIHMFDFKDYILRNQFNTEERSKEG
jgi:hypothetical protein